MSSSATTFEYECHCCEPGNFKVLRILWMNNTMLTGNIPTMVTLNSAFANFANTRTPSAGETRGE